MTINYSKHASRRMQQRGLSHKDISMVINMGTYIDDDSIILLNSDVEREITKRKKEIQRLEKLRSVRVVACENDTVVTAYKTNRKIEKALLRGLHRHSQKNLS